MIRENSTYDVYFFMGGLPHELSEQECLHYFPVIKDAIIAMSKQDYWKSENDKKQNELREKMLEIEKN